MKEETTARILRTLPREKAFYFFTSIGNYTGESAISFKEFMNKINEVSVKSLEFHLYRGDFEKWIAETLEDPELTSEIESLRNQNYSGTALKEQLYNILTKHYEKIISKF
ncbi:MAG: DUF5752 family protein [Candidatus Bathyarchaeota archaeon]|nr:DUF5752 family protein [Candidatus Bathyarchaeota archaeon]MDH5747574.1 DUF5752 family protein [Candidatus Bathyarchaeota archaeon]